MALPKANVQWPPRTPLYYQQRNLLTWYAGLNPVLYDNVTPYVIAGLNNRTIGVNQYNIDPAGLKQTNDVRTHQVGANIVADFAGAAADLLLGSGPRLLVNQSAYNNNVLSEEDANFTETMLATLMHESGAWPVLRSAAELASVTGEAYVRVIADPEFLDYPLLQVVPSTYADPTWRYGKLVSVRLWSVVAVEGAQVLRWVEERDNQARVIRNALYMGSDTGLGEQLPLSAHPATAHLPIEESFPDGVDKMVWHLPNATPSRIAPSLPNGRSDFEGSLPLIAALDSVYTSLAREFRLGQARLIVPTASLSRGLTGGQVWNHNREIMTDLDLDPTNPASRPELFQTQLRVNEHIAAAEDLIVRIVEAAGYSPQTFGLGKFGHADSGVALRIRTARTIQTVTAKRTIWAPKVASIVETLTILANRVYGIDITPVRPVVEWPELVTPDPEAESKRILTLVQAGAVSIETAVSLAQPNLGDEEVHHEVERIRAERLAGIGYNSTQAAPMPLSEVEGEMDSLDPVRSLTAGDTHVDSESGD